MRKKDGGFASFACRQLTAIVAFRLLRQVRGGSRCGPCAVFHERPLSAHDLVPLLAHFLVNEVPLPSTVVRR